MQYGTILLIKLARLVISTIKFLECQFKIQKLNLKGDNKMKIKKMLSIIMAMVLLIACISIPASAEPISASPMQMIAMSGSDASDTMKNRIEQAGVSVTDESIIQLVPISSSQKTQSRALVITNEVGNTITKDVLLMATDEGVGFEQGGDVSTRAGSSAEFPPLSWDGRYVVRGTAVYNQYSDGLFSSYYQPTDVYFTYQKYKNCTVNSIELLYICDGFEYSYPGFNSLGDTEREYIITVSKSSPAPSTMYSTSRPYSSNRVIFTASGSPFVGQFLTFNTVVDGKSDGYTVKL